MRKLLSIALIIFTASFAQAQDAENSTKSIKQKVNTAVMPIINIVEQPVLVNRKTTMLAGIFVIKNSRVKRALSFKLTTKNPKLV